MNTLSELETAIYFCEQKINKITQELMPAGTNTVKEDLKYWQEKKEGLQLLMEQTVMSMNIPRKENHSLPIASDEVKQEKAKTQYEYYDSTSDTLLHIKRVNQLLTEASAEFIRRANCHDASKLQSPEKELFDKLTPKLKTCTYGSEEYQGYLKELKVALDHHYANNSHHPEHYANGIDAMDLFDILEMFLDWKAATERHADGDIYKSLIINQKRFGISEQLINIFTNTAKKLNYEK